MASSKIELDIERIRKALAVLDLKHSVYCYLLDELHKTDVSVNSRYQHEYSNFYGMLRFPTAAFRKVYFDYMESAKDIKLTQINGIIKHIYEKTGRMELSFASKMLHTINPEMPIWDSRIQYHLGLKARPLTLAKVTDYYNNLDKMYYEYFGTPNAEEIITVFDRQFPNTNYSLVKKVDTCIWSLGPKPKTLK